MRRLLTPPLAILVSVALASSTTVLLPTAAQAARTAQGDARDTQGDLDLQRVRLTTSGQRIVATLTTYAATSRDDLDNANSLELHFKVAPQRTRRVLVQWLGDGLVATICTRRTSSPVSRDCSDVRVRPAGPSAVRVVIPRAKIKEGAKAYRWRASSTAWTRTAGCSTAPYCEDLVPSSGRYLVWRP